ncbi:MAG: hypothetical protein R2834_06755 [Rhodothermales bacterium]
MDYVALRETRVAQLSALFAELYALPVEPEMLGQRADIIHEVDMLCAAYQASWSKANGSRQGLRRS